MPGRAATPLARAVVARLRAALAGGLGEALWLFVALRAGLSLFALLASYLSPLAAPCTWEGGPALHTAGLDFRLLGVWQHWDACWYQKIAALGYRPHDGAAAFFPLYPLLMRLVAAPLAGNLTLAGLIVSGLAYLAAAAGLYRLVRDDFDGAVAGRAALYLSVFPAAFFLFAPFTESLFLALAVWTLRLARRGAWRWVAPLALAAGLTRTQGALLALPLAWESVRLWRAGRHSLVATLVPFLPAAGLLLFLAYSRAVAGTTALQAQGAWGVTVGPPWATVAASWRQIVGRGDVVEALNLAWLALFTALLVAGLRRLPFSYTLYAAPQLLLIALHQNWLSPLMSASRFALAVFPAFVVLALWGRHRRLHEAWVVVSSLLLALLLYAYLNGAFIA